MKISPKWLWGVVVIILLTYGVGITNPFLEDSRNILFLVVIVFAVKTSFFSKKNKS